MVTAATGLKVALEAVELIHLIAVAGGNVVVATQEISLLLQKKHAAGETLTREEMLAVMDRGDILQAEEIARLKESIARQAQS